MSSLLIIAALVGGCLGLGVGGGGVWLYGKWQLGLARKGWALEPVVIARRDLPPGTVVTIDDLDQRSVPEMWVTASVITPDSASYVVNQPLNVPIAKGEPLRWAYFATWAKPLHPLNDRAAIDACTLEAASRTPSGPQSFDQIRARLEKRALP